MKSMSIFVGGCLAVISAVGAVDPAPIVSVSLYKNGNAFLTRKVTPKNGVATVEIPACLPSYGTFWHTANAPVRVTTVTEPRMARVTFRADPQMGALIAEAEKGPDRVVTIMAPREDEARKACPGALFTVTGECVSRELQELECRIRLASGSLVKIDAALIVASSGLDDPATGNARASRFWKFEGSGEPFGIQYLTGGAAWAPSYLLVFGRDGKADLLMNAEIRNEIADWKDVDVSLISGFPSIQYADSKSLIGGLDLPQFIQGPVFRDVLVGKMAKGMRMNYAPECAEDACLGGAKSAAYQAVGMSDGAGSDIHYRPIGKLSLKKGETVALPLGSKTTDYKRIVDWNIADRRDYWGRLTRNDDSAEGQVLWDSVKFNNPFEFPLTTGAIEIVEDGRIVGQAQCAWTNPGDETLVKITKALSVKGRCEEESDGKGVRSKISSLAADERFHYDDHDYRKETITAKIRVQNFRKEVASLNVKKVFSGELVESDLKPTKTRNLPVHDGRVNVERELVWEFDLQPGETKEIKVVYWLWVRM